MSMETSILSCYESLALASARLLQGARERDADAMERAQAECGALIGMLRELGDGHALSPGADQRKMQVLRRLLADDAEIRDLTQPWLKTLESMLGGSTARRRLDSAYG